MRLCRERVDLAAVRAVVANSGNANAATGRQGLDEAARVQGAGGAIAGVTPEHVAVASTGVIGVPLDGKRIVKALHSARAALSATGATAFAEADPHHRRLPEGGLARGDAAVGHRAHQRRRRRARG